MLSDDATALLRKNQLAIGVGLTGFVVLILLYEYMLHSEIYHIALSFMIVHPTLLEPILTGPTRSY